MLLWTVQSIEWHHELLKNGTICGTRKHITQDWEFSLFGYRWLMKKMDEKVGKRPFPTCFPVWAWYQYNDTNRRKPDLRSTGFLPKGKKGVRLEINKDEKDVLLSDFMLWGFPFSHHGFIGENEQESVAFDEILARRGLDKMNIGKLPKDIHTEIVKSWDRVLDLDFNDPYHAHPREKKAIQATFWTLSLDEVVNVDEFIARVCFLGKWCTCLFENNNDSFFHRLQ